MENINIGMIGISEGNGHPYSWSAIINGYDEEHMKSCPFPVIPEYLGKQTWPESAISNATVSSIWTQDERISKQIAKASNIKNICKNIESLKSCDCIMLARDDYKNHLRHSKFFLEKGIPIYIDKPIATSIDDLDELYSYQKYEGQIFTCSALRFCSDLKIKQEEKSLIGEIQSIKAITPKDWEKYSIHVIEPVLNLIPNQYDIKSSKLTNPGSSKQFDVIWNSNIITTFISTGDNKQSFEIEVIGSLGKIVLKHKNTFSAFKNAIEVFLRGVRQKTIESPKEYNRIAVDIISRGIKKS